MPRMLVEEKEAHHGAGIADRQKVVGRIDVHLALYCAYFEMQGQDPILLVEKGNGSARPGAALFPVIGQLFHKVYDSWRFLALSFQS